MARTELLAELNDLTAECTKLYQETNDLRSEATQLAELQIQCDWYKTVVGISESATGIKFISDPEGVADVVMELSNPTKKLSKRAFLRLDDATCSLKSVRIEPHDNWGDLEQQVLAQPQLRAQAALLCGGLLATAVSRKRSRSPEE